jgi:hypothetical protein
MPQEKTEGAYSRCAAVFRLRKLTYARRVDSGMNSFDYLFSFYGLLLGIALANVAIGFADMWRDCEKIRVGTCPPLLCGIVMLGGMNVWLTMWHIRQEVGVSAWQMLAAACVAMPYVFVSRAMFPGQERRQETSLEDHYLRHRILILAVMTVPPIASVVSKALLDKVHDIGWGEIWLAARIGMPLVLMALANRTAQRVGLGVFLLIEFLGLFR